MRLLGDGGFCVADNTGGVMPYRRYFNLVGVFTTTGNTDELALLWDVHDGTAVRVVRSRIRREKPEVASF